MAIIDQKGIFGTRKRQVIFQRCHLFLQFFFFDDKWLQFQMFLETKEWHPGQFPKTEQHFWANKTYFDIPTSTNSLVVKLQMHYLSFQCALYIFKTSFRISFSDALPLSYRKSIVNLYSSYATHVSHTARTSNIELSHVRVNRLRRAAK